MANEVRIEITGTSSKYERAARDAQLVTKKATTAIRTSWLQVAGALYTVTKAWDLMQMAARADQERAAFNNLAASYGANADFIVMKLKQASGHAMDTMTLVNKAGTAMMMGITPDKLHKLMEIARTTARMTGQSVSKAFDDISLAVGRQSRMILDNLGIIVQVGKANEQYAAILGKAAGELTDVEKRQAFLNATVKAGEELMARMGQSAKTASEHFQTMDALSKDAMVFIGRALNEILRVILIVFTTFSHNFNLILETFFSAIAKIQEWQLKLPGGEWVAEKLGFDVIHEKTKAMAEQFKFARENADEFIKTLMKLNYGEAGAGGAGFQIPAGIGGEAGAGPGDSKDVLREQRQLHQMLIDEATEYDAAIIQGHEAMYQYELELIRERLQLEAEIRREQRAQDLEEANAYDQSLIDAHEGYLALYEEQKKRELEIEQRTQEMKTQATQLWLQATATTMTAMQAFMGKKGKALFRIAQGIEAAKATIAAFSAFNQALSAPPGAPYTIPVAAATLAMGLAQVAAIMATSIGGGTAGGGGGLPAATTGSAGVTPATTPSAMTGDQTPPQVNIYFEGDVRIEDEAYIEELAERLSDAVQDREVMLMASNAKVAQEVY